MNESFLIQDSKLLASLDRKFETAKSEINAVATHLSYMRWQKVLGGLQGFKSLVLGGRFVYLVKIIEGFNKSCSTPCTKGQ